MQLGFWLDNLVKHGNSDQLYQNIKEIESHLNLMLKPLSESNMFKVGQIFL